MATKIQIIVRKGEWT